MADNKKKKEMWIKTTGLFKSEMSKVEWDLFNDDEKYENSEPMLYRFNTEHLICYNESSHGQTTIMLREYGTIVIDMKVSELDKIIFSNFNPAQNDTQNEFHRKSNSFKNYGRGV